jgi:hypothetical protein
MGIKIDNSKLKLKFNLRLHRKMDDWPNSESLLYEIARYVELQSSNKMPKDKLYEIVGNSDTVESLIGSLVEDGYVQDLNDSVELITHDWR